MKNDQKTYWDMAASTKEFTTPFAMDEFCRHVAKTDRILDVGCGYGRVVNTLFNAGFTNVCGVDYASKMIDRGARCYPHLDLQTGSRPFAFKDNTFDAVLLVAVLTCMVDDKEQKAMIREIQRLLRPGGILYVNDFLLNTDARNLQRYQEFESRYQTYGVFELAEGAVLRHHHEAYLKELMSPFDSVAFVRCTYTTMNQHTANGFYYLGRLK